MIVYKLIIYVFSTLIFATSIYAQYVGDDTTDFYAYYRISEYEYVNTWSIANYDRLTSISDIYTDGKNRFYFSYYDRILGKPIFVTGTGKSFKKMLVDSRTFRGHGIALAVDPNSFEAHIAYINEYDSSLQYANNIGFKFENYQVDKLGTLGFKNISIVVSAFREPIIFFLNKSNYLYLSRYYKGNFFTESVYTNTKLKAVVPFLRDGRYSMFMQNYENGDIFYASRTTNTAFRFYDSTPLVENANKYLVYFDNNKDFIITYNTKDNENRVAQYRYLSGEVKKDYTILEAEDGIQEFAADYLLENGTTILYRNNDGKLKFYHSGDDIMIDLSVLGATEGELKLKSIGGQLYVFIYKNATTKELKLALLNAFDTSKMVKSLHQ